jgi:hypothetical protein
MSDKPEQTTTTSQDTTISQNGDTAADRYRKIRDRESKMSDAERIKKLREATDFLICMMKTNPDFIPDWR